MSISLCTSLLCPGQEYPSVGPQGSGHAIGQPCLDSKLQGSSGLASTHICFRDPVAVEHAFPLWSVRSHPMAQWGKPDETASPGWDGPVWWQFGSGSTCRLVLIYLRHPGENPTVWAYVLMLPSLWFMPGAGTVPSRGARDYGKSRGEKLLTCSRVRVGYPTLDGGHCQGRFGKVSSSHWVQGQMKFSV